MKFSQCYTDVAKVPVHFQYAKFKNQMLRFYSVTAHPRVKSQKKYVNYHKLFCWTLKVHCSLH